jgi:hypothetical protein
MGTPNPTSPVNPQNAIFTPPTTNVDGSPIAAGEIASYLLQVGLVASAGQPQTFPTTFSDLVVTPAANGTISVPVSDLGTLAPGNYVGTVSAVTAGGVISAPSNVANFSIGATVVTPNPPTGLTFA